MKNDTANKDRAMFNDIVYNVLPRCALFTRMVREDQLGVFDTYMPAGSFNKKEPIPGILVNIRFLDECDIFITYIEEDKTYEVCLAHNYRGGSVISDVVSGDLAAAVNGINAMLLLVNFMEQEKISQV